MNLNHPLDWMINFNIYINLILFRNYYNVLLLNILNKISKK